MIYFDNAATSYPKPSGVVRALGASAIKYGANPGRGGHKMSLETAEKVYETRSLLDDFFNGYGSEYVCFTSNCTQALNTAIFGLISKGEHIVISCLEHNSVVRPVQLLQEKGVADYSVFDVGSTDVETLQNFENAFRDNTGLCVVTAVSNVFGDVLPLAQMSQIAHLHGAHFVVDGAQGAGVIPLDMKSMGIDCLCIPGHKGLLGPMGTGALLINGVSINPLTVGGTGTKSMSLLQPLQYPERLESGTLNVVGICALGEGVKIVKNRGVENIYTHEKRTCKKIADELMSVGNVKVYTTCKGEVENIVSFNIGSLHSEQTALKLSEYGIAVRGGYQCSALAHSFRGTEKSGVVRISPSFYTTKKDINYLLNLVRKIAFENNI